MMKKYETKTVEVEKEVLISFTCDWCGKEINRTGPVRSYVDVKCEVIREHRSWGDCETLWIDMCPECFRKKLVPFLKENGCEVQEDSYNF